MASLKAFLPEIAKAFGTTADALYSRQRALVRLGLLPVTKGKGPGSGVPLTPDTFGVMLISLLAAETLAETDERIARLCEATPANFEWDDTRQNFVEAKTFRAAVSEVALRGLNVRGYFVKSLRVSRSRGQLVIVEGTAQKRRMLTKTYVASTKPLLGLHSPIVRTNEVELGGLFEMNALFNKFAIAAEIPDPLDDDEEGA